MFANKEKASDIFANNLMNYVVTTIWPDGVVLDWVEGREGETTLAWNSGYVSFVLFLCPPSMLIEIVTPTHLSRWASRQ